MKTRWVLGERRRVIDWPIAREDAAAEKAVAAVVGRKLKVAVEVSIADPIVEPLHDVGRLGERDDPLHLDAGPEPELHARDQPEQPVSANRQAEEVRLLMA